MFYYKTEAFLVNVMNVESVTNLPGYILTTHINYERAMNK